MAVNSQSHRNLKIALCVSSVAVLVLLELLPRLAGNGVCSAAGCPEIPRLLNVSIEPPEPATLSAVSLPDLDKRPEPAPSQPAPAADTDQAAYSNEPAKSASDGKAARDWQALAKVTASRSIDDRFKQEALRKSLWRDTRSVMFRDTGEFAVQEPATIIANREFRVPVGVLGIGITIGGCFFGIPLAGIPVEKRTVGPTLIYCVDLYQ